MRDLRQLLPARQDTAQEAQCQIGHGNGFLAVALMRQHSGQQLPEAVPMEKTSQRQQSSPSADFLVGEPDLDRLFGNLESNEVGHCLVSRFPCGN